MLNQAINNQEVDSTEIMMEVVKAAENKDFGKLFLCVFHVSSNVFELKVN